MNGILDWLGLANLFSGSPSGQVEKPGAVPGTNPAPGPAEKPMVAQTGGDASRSAGGGQQAALSDTMMKLLLASIVANPTPPVNPPGGGPAPIRPQPFQYSPMGGMAVGPRGRL